MSGPIVRKYGFPNFEKIFGERDLQHGADEDASEETPSKAESSPAPEAQAKTKAKPAPRKSKKKS